MCTRSSRRRLRGLQAGVARRIGRGVTMLATVGAIQGCSRSAALTHRINTVDTAAAVRPLILADSEGERRLHRPPPAALSNLAAPFIIKVDRRNGGAPEFVLFTEDIAPGQAVRPHRHPDADEILFIHAGTGVVKVADREAAVSSGALIYPRTCRVRAAVTCQLLLVPLRYVSARF